MSNKLMLNISLMGKEPCHEPDKCVVEKTISISHSEFEKINSKLLERNYHIAKYKELMLEADGINHCILLYDRSGGDGLLVNSEGCGYARYSQYIPHATDDEVQEVVNQYFDNN